MIGRVDDIRVGRVVRALRRRLGWRQADLAARADVSQQTVSLIERGQLGAMSLRRIRVVARTADAEALLTVRWRGGELDRLLDDAHARLITATVARRRATGWETVIELTYSVFGERGSIDVVGWRGLERALVILEIKSELTSAEATLRKHDEKVRLAGRIVSERFGWVPLVIGRLLVVPESSTARRRVQAGGGLIARSYPVRGAELRAWLRTPVGPIAGLLFLPSTSPRGGKRRIRASGRAE